MATHPPPAPNRSFELGDIYYTVFRHKWKILLCSLAGFALAFTFYKLRPPPFESEAKLFIRYVITEGKSLGPGRDESITKSPDQRGETIMSSEVEILTSSDLAQEVAKIVGPDKILGTGANAIDAAFYIQHNLRVEAPRTSSVIRLAFYHTDPAVTQLVLKELVASYKKKHSEIHRAGGMVADALTLETDQLRNSLNRTEEDLRKLLNQANISSLEDYKRNNGEQTAGLSRQILALQAELAQRIAMFQEMNPGAKPAAAAVENQPAIPPAEKAAVPPAQEAAVPPAQQVAAPSAEPAAVPPAEQVEAYRRISEQVATLSQQERQLLIQFKEESDRVKTARAQLAEAEEKKRKMESEFPALLSSRPSAGSSPAGRTANTYDPVVEGAEIKALQAKLNTLQGQLGNLRSEAAKVNEVEIRLVALQRQKDLQEKNYNYYFAKLDQSRIDESLGSGSISNIGDAETPTPPVKDWSKAIKTIGGIAAGGIVLGLGWAFLIELFLDRSVRKPIDIEKILHVPLFLSIPKLKAQKPARKMLGNGNRKALLPGAVGAAPSSALVSTTSLSASEVALTPYYETLRDRLFSFFDSRNIRHKPKLVALTGIGTDSGVTTVAAGLARSISETGEGNVLLVDMTQGQGSAQHFHHGKSVGLEQLFDTRQSAQVQDNLYVVGESSSSERLAKGMPQRFNQLVPKLKASDFDYIIFDMPPVNQISITPRLASFMDMVLLVVESEKTDRDIAEHAAALLSKSNANVGVVMNKTKSYIPARLHQDRDFLLGT